MIKRYHTTGEVPPRDDVIYVERDIDRQFLSMLQRNDRSKVPVLYGCRQSGKTSLVFRLLEIMARQGAVGFVDLRDVIPDGTSKSDPEQFGSQLMMAIAASTGRLAKFRNWWSDLKKSDDAELTSVLVKFKRFLLEVMKPDEGKQITLFIDELDRVLSFGRSWEFLLDATYDVARDSRYSFIRFVLIGLNRLPDLARSQDIAKFTQFEELRVTDFDPENAGAIEGFAEGLEHIDDPATRRTITTAVLEQTAGQPFLTSYLLDSIVQEKIAKIEDAKRHVEKLIAAWSPGDNAKFGSRPVHFQQAEKILLEFRDNALPVLDAYASLLDNRAPNLEGQPVMNVLLGSGLAAETQQGLQVRSPIYRRVFDARWLEDFRDQIIRATASEPKMSTRGPRHGLAKVLVLNLGGTLGMAVDNSGRLVSPSDPKAFFSEIPYLSDLIDPIVETPIASPTDGANIVPPNWVRVAETIHAYRGQDIAGVLVVAGTDTLAYAASAVAFALGPSLHFPVVFTGSQAPVTKLHADAQANILRAGLVAREGEALPEVVVVFNDVVLRAVRTEKVDDYRFTAFAAPSTGPLAIIGEAIQYQSPVRRAQLVDNWQLRASFEERVLKMAQYPGLPPRYIETLIKSGEVKGLVIESLGLGNVPVVEHYSLIPAIEFAIERQIPVLISGRYPIQPEFIEFYQPATLPLRIGAISAGDMTPPAALTKFMWAIRQVDDGVARNDIPANRRLEQVKKIMTTDYIGEIGTAASTRRILE